MGKILETTKENFRKTLEKIPVGNYIVNKEPENPNCMYKLFPDLPREYVINLHRSGYDSGGTYILGKYRVTTRVEETYFEFKKPGVGYYNPRGNISIETNREVQVFTDVTYEKDIFIINGVEVRTASTEFNPRLAEDLGGYYFEKLGYRFDLMKKLNDYTGRYLSSYHFNMFHIFNFLRINYDKTMKGNYIKIIEKLIKANPQSYSPIKNKVGIVKTLKDTEPFYDGCSILTLKAIFRSLTEVSDKTIKGVKFSTIFNKIFSVIKTQSEFDEKMQEIYLLAQQVVNSYGDGGIISLCEKIIESDSGAREIQKASIKRKQSGAFNKIMDDLDFVDIDEKRYPLAHTAVHGGDIPLGTFFRKKGDSYFMYNDNWELWEKMLKLDPVETIKIAKSASVRTTYEKDLMSYFYFILEALPNYLNTQYRNRKYVSSEDSWKCLPKLVDSLDNELTEPIEGSSTIKKRSALTPIVDNEEKTVTVPYAALVVSGGYGSSYCYGLDFNVLQKGVVYKGNTVTKDVETALNGRDDYGLMFYTLTGSPTAVGYPTFLIIFEHIGPYTKLHFHRVHPTRSKDGEYNSIHNWTKSCYKWMVGNVNFDNIAAQQGDLVFVKTEKFPIEKNDIVTDYDSHKFLNEVEFAPYSKKEKSNILGYIRTEDNWIKHPEHADRYIPGGIYEIRQCKSWEANPKGIWSLRID